MAKTTPSQDLIRTCTKCKVSKPFREFYTSTVNGRAYYYWKCKKCRDAEKTVWIEKNKGEWLKGRRRWYKERIAAMTPDELKEHRRTIAANGKRWNTINKEKVFAAYGGAKCACCGETEKTFLSIDHIDGGGSKLRKAGTHSSGSLWYKQLVQAGFPPGFQILCMNCQFGKHANKGVCPHQVRRNDQSGSS